MTSIPSDEYGRERGAVGLYRQKYVAYLDMLGFKALTLQADDNEQLRDYICDVLSIFRNTMGENEGCGALLTHFSDSLIVSADRTEEGLHLIFLGCRLVAENLMQRGILLRGGVVVGNLYHTNDAVFGPSLIEAVACDRGPPHIIVSQEVKNDLRSYGAKHDLSLLVTNDPDGVNTILHTLLAFEVYDKDIRRPGTVILDGPARTIVNVINYFMSLEDENVREKWCWFCRYWNTSVKQGGCLPLSKLC